MKPIRLLGISASVLLLAGSAQAQLTFFTNGVVRHQFWANNPPKLQVEQGTAGNPTYDDFSSASLPVIAARTAAPTSADFGLSVFDTPEEEGDNYVDRVSALFLPPVTGKYVFFVSSDDDADLFLSTDATPTNKRMIAQETSWANTDQWLANDATGGIASQKRSDQWTNGSGATPFSGGISLTQGQKYWIEAVHHEGGGGDQVGATFKLVSDPDPANGTASALSGAAIGYGLTFTSPITVKTQVTNTTVKAGNEASFTFVPNNPSSDPSVNPLTFQWSRNGTPLPGAIGPSYTFNPTAADSGAQFQCVASLDPIYNLSLSVTSAVGTVTVQGSSQTYTNGLKIERFFGSVLSDVENNSTGPAHDIFVSINGAEAVPNDGINNYARRMSGWFIPPTTGNYVFFLSSDDDADLFLSTDATPSKKQLIAQESNWSPSRGWVGNTNTDTTSAGGTLLSQKRSDQWTNGTGTAPFASGIALTAGTPYYIEADSHQGGGGDNLGVLAQIVGNPDPTNGAPPIPASELSLVTSPTTTLNWTNQPKSTTVFEGGQPVFTAGATSDSEFGVLYQWQRNGTNIPGASKSSYTFTTVAADNNTPFQVIASTAEGGLSITSTVANLTVQGAVFEQGLALMQYWINQPDQTVGEAGGFPAPDFTMAVPVFEAGVNNENGDNFVDEVSGFLVPAVSQAYDFIVTGDDHCDFFLSTDSNPNNKRLICQEPGWSNALTWGTDNGGGTGLQQKHSATWVNSANATPFANGISLTAGIKRHYIEVWHQEGTGGDSVSVYMKKHGDPDPADGTDGNITGSLLGFNAPAAHYVAFTAQPTNASAISGNTVSFAAGGISDGNIPIGTTGLFEKTGATAGATNFVHFPNVLFQWYKNSTLIPGATTSTYTTPPLKPSDNNAQYYAAIRALGIANWSNSTAAVVTVITDTNKPTAFASTFLENGLSVATVSFSKTMDLASISDMTHYSISGGATITGILVNSNDARHVQLQLSGAPTLPAQVTLTGITDFSGNAPTSTTLSVTAAELVNADIGDPQVPDPAWPGNMWSDGPNAYTIDTQGSDIWGAGDGFNFSYESKTNDFDVVVRQLTFTKVSNWSKGGLMVREDLTPQSRNWNIINDPTSADGVTSIDGSGTGANTIESNCRSTNGQASLGWAVASGHVPTYPNAWVRLKRTGQILQSFYSSNGVDWVREGLADVSTNANGPLPASMYVGICGTAHNNNSVTATVLNYYYEASFDNYNSAFIASSNAPQASLKASLSGGNVVISWTPTGGTLQSSPTVGAGATWTPVGTANPATVPLSGGSAKFFRVGP